MSSVQTQRSGYRSSSSLSPASLAGVVIVHLGLGAAVLSMTAIKVLIPEPDILWIKNIAATPPKTEAARPEPTQATPHETHVTSTKPVIDLPKTSFDPLIKSDPIIPTGTGGTGPLIDAVKPVDPMPPVIVDARPDARFMRDFQPAYPAAMLRIQMEGAVTVRVMIGADGRVLDVALVSAADPAFFEATRRQALSRWRFTPATRDGVPVPSERLMTVHFRLSE